MFDLTATDYQAVWLSARVALTATLLALPAGFLMASLLAFGRFRGKGLLEGILHLPMVLPPVVVGYLLLLLLGEHGPFGSFLRATGIRIIFTWWAAVLASLVVGLSLCWCAPSASDLRTSTKSFCKPHARSALPGTTPC